MGKNHHTSRKHMGISASTLTRLGLRTGPNWLWHQIIPYQPEYNMRRHGPIYCGLYLTFRCNLTCPWCVIPPFPKGQSINDYEATPASVEKIVGHPLFRTVAYINLTGGEPFMNKHIFDIVRFLRKRRFLLGIVTNGLLLESRMDDIVKHGINDIRISIYKHTASRIADILPRLRGKMMAATSYIILKSDLHDNPGSIEEIVRLCSESGCIATRMNFYLPMGKTDRNEVVYEDDPALADLKRRLAARFPKYSVLWRPAARQTITGARNKTCRQLWETFHVDALGNLGLCCKLCGTFDAKGGNLFTSEPGDLFNSDYLKNMRGRLLSVDDIIPEACADCFYINSSKATIKAIRSPLPRMIRNKLFSTRKREGNDPV